MRRLPGKQLDKCHEATVPCLVAPALAHGPPQAMLDVNVLIDGTRYLAGKFGKENARLEPEMRVRPKHRRSRYAVLPDPSGGAIAKHRGGALPRRSPWDLPAERYLGLRDVKSKLLGECVLIKSLRAAELLPRFPKHGRNQVPGLPGLYGGRFAALLKKFGKLVLGMDHKRSDVRKGAGNLFRSCE